MPKPLVGRLHALTDIQFQQRLTHAELAALAASGGADAIQFRQKSGTAQELLIALEPTVRACRNAGVVCIVNDRIDLALAADADGVHLGQHDLPIAHARSILDRMGGRTRIIGATVTNADDARRAEDAGADYLGFGPVYPTESKANPASVKGLDGLADACQAVGIPVIAIAGILLGRVGPCLDAGAWGVAVMTAISTTDDPRLATEEFAAAIGDWMATQ